MFYNMNVKIHDILTGFLLLVFSLPEMTMYFISVLNSYINEDEQNILTCIELDMISVCLVQYISCSETKLRKTT